MANSVQGTANDYLLAGRLASLLLKRLMEVGHGYVQVDETPVRYLAPGHGKTKTGYFWTTSRPGSDAVYRWETSRAATCLDKVLPVDFKGTMQCDGYTAYASYAQRKERIQLAACWAHARRKFYEAREQDPGIAHWLLRQIGHQTSPWSAMMLVGTPYDQECG